MKYAYVRQDKLIACDTGNILAVAGIAIPASDQAQAEHFAQAAAQYGYTIGEPGRNFPIHKQQCSACERGTERGVIEGAHICWQCDTCESVWFEDAKPA